MKSPADVSHYRLLNNVLGVIHTAGPHARTCTCPLTMIIRAMSLQSSRLAARIEKSMLSRCGDEVVIAELDSCVSFQLLLLLWDLKAAGIRLHCITAPCHMYCTTLSLPVFSLLVDFPANASAFWFPRIPVTPDATWTRFLSTDFYPPINCELTDNMA